MALITVFTTLLLAGCGINNIPTYDESVNARWSDVQIQYKRRVDLIPLLIDTVKPFADQSSHQITNKGANQEADALQQVTAAHAKVRQTTVSPEILSDETLFQQFQQNQYALSNALVNVMVTMAEHPGLKTDENFIQLQNELEDTANLLAIARRNYTQAVERYNTELHTIPGSWWHQFMYTDMQPKVLFIEP